MKKLFNIISGFVMRWPGLSFGIIIAFLGAFAYPIVANHFFPAGSFDVGGTLHLAFVAVMAFLILHEISFGGIKFNFPDLYNDYKARNINNNLTAWQKQLSLLALLFGYLFSLSAIALAVAIAVGRV